HAGQGRAEARVARQVEGGVAVGTAEPVGQPPAGLEGVNGRGRLVVELPRRDPLPGGPPAPPPHPQPRRGPGVAGGAAQPHPPRPPAPRARTGPPPPALPPPARPPRRP